MNVRSSPLVRKLAKEHSVDLAQVQGTGRRAGDNRLLPSWKKALKRHLSRPQRPRRCAACTGSRTSPAPIPGELRALTKMRSIIAQRMIESRRTSAHVHCMFEVDLTRIANLRNNRSPASNRRNGARLTFMPFFVRGAIIALQQFPIVNASLEGDSIRYHRNINVGIAVALVGPDRSRA